MTAHHVRAHHMTSHCITRHDTTQAITSHQITWAHITSHCITWHDTTQAFTLHQMTWPPHQMTWHASKHVTSPPWNSRRLVHSKEMVSASAGRSPCAHSIGKFFPCYILLFSSETSAPGSPGNYLYTYMLGCPLPVRVTTGIITFLVGNPYKPSFPLLLGGWTTQHICFFGFQDVYLMFMIEFA